MAEECPDAKFYQIDTFSDTRFAAYTYRVFVGFMKDSPFIIISLERRALGSDKKSAEEAKRLLKKIANVFFLGNLAGLCDLYKMIGQTCTALQRVNLFLWERTELVQAFLSKLERMKEALQNADQNPIEFAEHWPVSAEYWPKLEANTFIAGIPYLEPDSVESYYTRRNSQQPTNTTTPFENIHSQMIKFIDSAVPVFRARLLGDEQETHLASITSTLTNLKDLEQKAKEHNDCHFPKSVDLDKFTNACRFVTDYPDSVTDEQLKAEINIFLTRLHPFLINGQDNPRQIFKRFFTNEQLYNSIPHFLQAVARSFLIGHNESYVESMGSVLKNHFPANRALTLENLEREVVIAWNGPSIPNCDKIVKETIDRMHGVNQWHFVRSHRNDLKFYNVSEAVDSLQNRSKPSYL